MIKLNKKTACTILIAAVLILAIVLRQIGFHVDDALGWICSILRSTIYIVLFTAWGISLRKRIIQPKVRNYLTAISVLMVFWITVRTVRFLFVKEPGVLRLLWYMYYLPMLFIPLFAVFVAMSLGKSDSFRVPKKTAFLYIPTTALFLLVLTNDMHQLVFTFPADTTVWGNDYHYAIGYYFAVGWMLLCTLTALGTMLLKCRIPHSRRVLVMPFIPVVLAVIYGCLYFARVAWLKSMAGDMTVVFCLLIAAVLESCIQCGLIQANTHYTELFDASTVGAQITDNEYQVLLSSASANTVDTEILRQTRQAPVMLEGGIRLSGAPIKNGYVIWTEDMSPLIKVLNELEEVKENLQDNNDILEEENAVKAREAHIAEQDRLYNIIRHDTEKQICLLDEMIEQVETADTDEKRRHLLKKMLVIGAYLKRRSNLVFLSDKGSVIDAKELELSIGESMNNLETFGVICGFKSNLTQPVLSAQMIAMYDFFETVTERSLDCADSIMVYASIRENAITFTVDTDANSDFSDLAGDTVTAVRDEDGEWRLTLRLNTGGDGC